MAEITEHQVHAYNMIVHFQGHPLLEGSSVLRCYATFWTVLSTYTCSTQ